VYFLFLHVTVTVSAVCLQTSKARAEARLEALRGAGIKVDEWLSENMANVDDDIDDGAVDSSTSGRLSPNMSAHSDLSDRVSICML